MGFPLGSILSFATRAIGVIPGAIAAVEAARRGLPGQHGVEKKAAVLSLVQAELAAAEQLAGRDLANDTDVLAAAAAIVDAQVAFHNLVARKAAAPAR